MTTTWNPSHVWIKACLQIHFPYWSILLFSPLNSIPRILDNIIYRSTVAAENRVVIREPISVLARKATLLNEKKTLHLTILRRTSHSQKSISSQYITQSPGWRNANLNQPNQCIPPTLPERPEPVCPAPSERCGLHVLSLHLSKPG